MSDTLESKQALASAMVELNHLTPRLEIIKKIHLGRHTLKFHWRSKKNIWGRFGGGWNWEIGLQASRPVTILNCLVFSLTWTRKKREAAND